MNEPTYEVSSELFDLYAHPFGDDSTSIFISTVTKNELDALMAVELTSFTFRPVTKIKFI